METRVIRNNYDKDDFFRLMDGYKLPCTVTIQKGKIRSYEQNKLQRKWLLEAQQQGDQTAEEYRGYCKLHFGVPILRNENEIFREKYDRIIRPLDYPTKLECMMLPLDFPITRLMTTGQKHRYLNDVRDHFQGLGFKLTIPEEGC